MAWLKRENLVRPSTAAVAGGVVVAVAAAVGWEFLGAGGASRRLLAPLIAYHKAQYEINRDRWQHDLDRAKEQMERVDMAFYYVKRSAGNASSLPLNSSYQWKDAWERVRFEARGVFGQINRVGEPLQDASMHEMMTIYHLHMRFYYERLLEDGAVRMPTLPRSLELDRKMIQLALLHRYGETLPYDDRDQEQRWHYESEPPPHLARPPRRRF
jgi:hypothetical protein